MPDKDQPTLTLYDCDGAGSFVEPRKGRHWTRQSTRLVRLRERVDDRFEDVTLALCRDCYNAVRNSVEPRHEPSSS